MASQDSNAPTPVVTPPVLPSNQAAATTFVTLPVLKDPGVFSGLEGSDVDQWLRLYERVSASYRWDPTLMLANVIFYLDGTPRVWFDTHEHDITSWDSFKEKIRELFGNPFGRGQSAKNELSARAQTSTESYISYIQSVLALCRRADENMSEPEKVAHILKGIADDAFNLLVFSNVTSVDAIIQECRRLEQAKSRRISHQFQRLPNTAATSSCLDSYRPPDTCDNLTRLVRRELEAAAPATVPPPHPDHSPSIPLPLIQAVVRQEIASMGICSISTPPRTDFQQQFTTPRPFPSGSPSTFRNPSAWRTHDDKPICFSCHRIGHVSRHCRSRWGPTTQTFQRSSNGRPVYRHATSPDHFAPQEPVSDPRYSRSPSPQRRQSRSPQPRRPLSPAFPRRSSTEN